MYFTTHYEPSDYKTVLIPRFDYLKLQISVTANDVTVWPYKLRYGPRYEYLTVKIMLGP